MCWSNPRSTTFLPDSPVAFPEVESGPQRGADSAQHSLPLNAWRKSASSTFCASSRRCSRARGPLRARSRARGACQLGPEHPVDIVGRRILHYAAPVCTIFNRAIFTVALAKRVLILLLLAPAVNVFVEKRR